MSKKCNKLCGVCSEPASGKHYNAFTCEGCKGFFRRSVIKNSHHECKFGQFDCIIRAIDRRRCCRRCRFDKCIEIGMKPELVDRKDREEMNQEVEDNSFIHLLHSITVIYSSTVGSLITQLLVNQCLEEHWKIKFISFDQNEENKIIFLRYHYFNFSTDLRTCLICLMCQINLFLNIPKETKEITIKEMRDCLCIILIASTYDSKQDTITWPGGQRLTRQFLLSSRFEPIVDNLFQLAWFWTGLNFSEDQMPFFIGLLLSSHWSILAASNHPFEFFSYILYHNQLNCNENQVLNLIKCALELAPILSNLLWF